MGFRDVLDYRTEEPDDKIEYEEMKNGTEIPETSYKIGDIVRLKLNCETFFNDTLQSVQIATMEDTFFKLHYSELKFKIVSFYHDYLVLREDEPVKSGSTYYIHPVCALDKVFDVFGNYPLRIYHKEISHTSNCFVAERQDNGYYIFKVKGTNHVLDVQNGNAQSGTIIQQWEYNGTDAQLWRLVDAGDGCYYIKSKLNSFYCMDIENAGTADFTSVWLYRGNGTAAQKFRFEPVEEAKKYEILIKPEMIEIYKEPEYYDNYGDYDYYDDDDDDDDYDDYYYEDDDDDDYYYDNDFDIGDTVKIKVSTSRYWTDLYDKSSRQNMKKEYLHYEWEVTDYDCNKNKFQITYYYYVTSTTGLIFKREVKTKKAISIVVTRNEITKVY